MYKQTKITIFTILLMFLLSSFLFAQKNRIVPIMILDNLPESAILGGVKDGKFIPAKTTVEALAEKQNYFMVDQEGKRQFDFVGAVKKNSSSLCPNYFRTDITAQIEFQGLGFGANADWNTAPRSMTELFNYNHYKPLVAKFLKKQGIRNPKVEISQIFYGDFDGDGRKDDIISGTNAASWERGGNLQRGDYSFVMIRKLQGGFVREILIEGIFLPNRPTLQTTFGIYSISAIADLNGDGKMEIVVSGLEYEKRFYKAFEIINAQKRQILQIGCEM